jgi:hypothetical protein
MSNETNKSAVEQLAIALYENGFLQGDGDRIQEIVEIFKEMNKEQHLKTWGNGWVNGDIPMDNYESVAENYYNETYGGNK